MFNIFWYFSSFVAGVWLFLSFLRFLKKLMFILAHALYVCWLNFRFPPSIFHFGFLGFRGWFSSLRFVPSDWWFPFRFPSCHFGCLLLFLLRRWWLLWLLWSSLSAFLRWFWEVLIFQWVIFSHSRSQCLLCRLCWRLCFWYSQFIFLAVLCFRYRVAVAVEVLLFWRSVLRS